MFSKQFAVLDDGALKRLENDAALFQLIGNNIAFDELVTGENQTRRDFIEPARLLENRVTLGNTPPTLNGARSRRPTLENRQA